MEPAADPGEVTILLAGLREGDPEAADRLMPFVYQELRRIAGGCLRWERQDHTLQPTALVNEAYLKLVAKAEQSFQNRAHFFGVAGSIMRHILVDWARGRQAKKRGGEVQKLQLDEALVLTEDSSELVLALHEALDQLAALSPRQAKVVELRFFGGLSIEETAEALNVTPRTVNREWSVAQAWLRRAFLPPTQQA